MRLRPRQKTFVERSVAALASRGNTLGVTMPSLPSLRAWRPAA